MRASNLKAQRRTPAYALLALLALLAAALLFSSAPYALANHEDDHVGPDEAPIIPFNPGSDDSWPGDSGPFIVGFDSEATIADRVYTAGVTDQDSSALPEATAQEEPFGGGTVSLAYSIAGLPDGLYLDDSRVIRGTPTAATDEPAQVTYSAIGTIIKSNGDAGGSRTVSLTFQVTVNPSVSFSAEIVEFYRTDMIVYDLAEQKWLDAGTDGKVLLPAASGGTGTLTYRLQESSTGRPFTEVASGVTFDPVTRKVGGTPPSLRFWDLTYSAEDENGSTASFSITALKRPRAPGGL